MIEKICGNNKFHIIYTYTMLFLMGLFLGLLSLYFGTPDYLKPIFYSYFNDFYFVILNLFPVIFTLFLLYFIFNRVWISFLFTSALTLTLSFANYWKLLIRNDPLLVMDLPLFFESLNMAGDYKVHLNWEMVVAIALCVLGIIFGFFFARRRLASIKIRLFSIIVLILMGALSFNLVYMDSEIYSSRANGDLKGFAYPLIHSMKLSFFNRPEGYNKKLAEEILYSYEYSDIADEKKVNIIAIMLESFNDFSKFDRIEFKEDLYEYYHQLKEESYSGEIVTNIFAGGTVNTEWVFLTGFTSVYNFRAYANSYAYYFKEQGYKVEGSHPGHDWFYNRKNINEYLGFENYYFYENYYAELADNQIAGDDILFRSIVKLYNANKGSGKPYFSFNVTYQNHGPYSTEKLTDKRYIINKGFKEEEYNILNNYFDGIYSTNREIKNLIDYFKNEDEPVVVILFGDHNPWLGNNNSVYKALDINIDLDTEEGFYNYYNTPYIIWGNDKAKGVLNNEFKGMGPTISANFLMSLLFDLVGYEGNEFMKASKELMKNIDVVHNNKLYKESGILTPDLTAISEEKLNHYLIIEYYWKKNFRPLK